MCSCLVSVCITLVFSFIFNFNNLNTQQFNKFNLREKFSAYTMKLHFHYMRSHHTECIEILGNFDKKCYLRSKSVAIEVPKLTKIQEKTGVCQM